MMREKKEINIRIGEQIKKARENAKLTQEQLAEKIDVSPQYISDLERGVVGISVEKLKSLCIALRVSSDEILFGNYKNKNSAIIFEKISVLSENHVLILSDIVNKYIEAVSSGK